MVPLPVPCQTKIRPFGANFALTTFADAMRQFFLFAKKHIRKATDQKELDESN